MVTALAAMLWGGVSLLIVGAVVFYAGLVTVIHFTGGLHDTPPINWSDPARAVLSLLVWPGVKCVGAIVRAVKPAYEMFTEASAELGELLLGRRSEKIEAAVWSRLRH